MVHNTVPKKKQLGLHQYVILCKKRFEVLSQSDSIISTPADQCVNNSPQALSLKASDHGKAPNKVKKCQMSHVDTRTCIGLAGFSNDKQGGAGGCHTSKQTSAPHIHTHTQSL